jgi:hypothetical protein
MFRNTPLMKNKNVSISRCWHQLKQRSKKNSVKRSYLTPAFDNFSNLSLTQGFVNCNIVSQQTISNLNTLNFKINNVNISNIFVAQNGGNMYDSLVFQKSTSGNPTTGYFDGVGARVGIEGTGCKVGCVVGCCDGCRDGIEEG